MLVVSFSRRPRLIILSIEVFNNNFYGVTSPILRKTYLKMAFLVYNLIINKSLSTLHNKKIINNVLYVHT